MPPPTPVAEPPDLNLLYDWRPERSWRRVAISGTASVLGHLLLLLLMLNAPDLAVRRALPRITVDLEKATPLYLPAELTQTDPNRGKVGTEFELKDLLPRPKLEAPVTPRASSTRPAAPRPSEQPVAAVPAPKPEPQPEPPPPPPAKPDPDPEPPPPVEIARAEPGITRPFPGQIAREPEPPPQIQAEEKPKLAFEKPSSYAGLGTRGAGTGRLPVPDTSVAEAMKDVTRGQQAGGMVVGDLGEGVGGLGSGLNLPPSPGELGSTLELKSDPMGVDFRPYLIQILSTVRRNWFAVIPQSARLGRQGDVVIQFAVAKDGSVPKLVIASSSGNPPLDRAAVAGISASNPFPPLPAEFKGNQIRLQFNFSYNRKRQ